MHNLRIVNFGWNKQCFWGHVITTRRIEVDSSEVEAILNWARPMIVGKIRSFLGLDGYYRRSIEEFSNISGPLTHLTHKGVKFEWIKKCERGFEELK